MNGDSDNRDLQPKLSLDELIQDPLIGLMMASDGVDRRTIELLFEQISCGRSRAAAGFRRRRQAARRHLPRRSGQKRGVPIEVPRRVGAPYSSSRGG